MPFNPDIPVNDTLGNADPIRENFNALKQQIDATPAGPQGIPGPAGNGIAELRDSGDGTGRVVIVLTDGTVSQPFTVASGPQGVQGVQGERGNDGSMGGTGPMGSPGSDGISVVNVYDYGDGRAIVQLSNGQTFGPYYVASGPAGSAGERGSDGSPGAPGVDGRSLTMRGDWDSATSYNPGDLVAYNGNVYVALYSASDTPPDVDGRWRVMTITGPAGGQGPAGNDGSPGPQGPQGEVSAQQLNDAINSAIGTAAASSSANTNAVQTLDTYADLPTAISKLNELINALRR